MSKQLPFEEWLTLVTETPEDVEPEWLRWLRETYELRGPISNDELELLAFDAWTTHAEQAFPDVLADIERTTGMTPQLEIWWPDWPAGQLDGWTVGLLLRSGRGETGTTVTDWGPDLASALVAVADFAIEPVTKELWSGWPVCPDDGYGLDPELASGRAVWRCRSPRKEVVAAIGELGLSR